MFSKTRIRNKLLISYSLLYALSLLIGFATFYFIIRNTIKANIESELNNTTTTIYNMVKTSAAVSIKNYLRSAAEKNVEIINGFYREHRRGILTEQEAKQQAAHVLLSQTIGESGYIYCLNGNGIVVVHPSKELLQADVSEYSFVKDLIVRKKGYLEYDWKNPDEQSPRPKALYTIYFEPWDWFVCVSSYREEFNGLVNIDDFRQSVLDLKFGKSGYSFVMDASGTAIIHPELEGINILTIEEIPNEGLEYILKNRKGRIEYPWKNPGEQQSRRKFCIFNHIEEYDWFVGAASYYDEFYGPLKTVTILGSITFGVTMLLVLLLTFGISESISAPLRRLMGHLSISMGDFSQRMPVASKDEIGELAKYYNNFMQQLEEYSSNLQNQIRSRRETEKNLRISEARYRLVMEAAADPIVIYDMEGKVTYFNPAFHKVFGWSLGECMGKKLDHFVPEENWPETQLMIEAIKAGKSLEATETKRYTSRGDIRTVSISGAAFRGHDQQLAGSVVILRDITETKRLTKRLMDIGDNVRQAIGQDLHDDLCPHLIGTGGLASALKKTIEDNHIEGAQLASHIIGLIHEATEKARNLARGLCPVHLVSFGLQSALKEIAEKTTASSGITCSFDGDTSIVFSDNTLATHLYYIVQEAVNNAVKHSCGSRIDISLYRKGGYTHLKITDNGTGIDIGRKNGGIGLRIMQHRALVIGAFLEITTPEGGGTVIHLFMKNSGHQDTTNTGDGTAGHFAIEP
ncbi:cache domain-containing protein [Desulforhopalus singaporensis]|uniref:histidine kinase n=1 Tax=Desulforhopalus singaporensis TaxID=91360 RepID=A0A1H0Q482_9BACT|nr:cache domain-containing protein [Desulforhopalus singaporensis]SDP12227.1 PAS domain S-box-containing protein [Desulforhopalus singaporensis]